MQKGVKYVDGDVIADDSYFAFERYGEGWSQDDLVWADGAPVSALTINDNVVFVNILPADRAGEHAFVSIIPFADYYHIDNRMITTPPGTGRRIFINREPGSTVLTLWGNIPLDDPGADEALAIEDPAEFAAALFRQLLEKRGIVVYGGQRTRHTDLASLIYFHGHRAGARPWRRRAVASFSEPAASARQSRIETSDRRRAGHQQSEPEPSRGDFAAAVGARKGDIRNGRGRPRSGTRDF